MDEILARFPNTLELTIASLLISIPGGIALGIIAAVTKRKWVDNASMTTALIGLSIPNFWLGIILIIVFGVKLGWVSAIGGVKFQDLILPAFTLALEPAAVLARLTRSSILEIIREDYVRTARADRKSVV